MVRDVAATALDSAAWVVVPGHGWAVGRIHALGAVDVHGWVVLDFQAWEVVNFLEMELVDVLAMEAGDDDTDFAKVGEFDYSESVEEVWAPAVVDVVNVDDIYAVA